VGDLVIIDIPCDGALFPFDGGIRNAGIIWIKNKTHLLQCPGEQVVP
jgi:hypothetical protein